MLRFFEAPAPATALEQEVASATAQQIAKLCAGHYLPRIEVPAKKAELRDDAIGILYLHVDEVYQLLQLMGTFEARERPHLVVLETCFAKASALLA